jgi:hypothetical protein
MSLSRVNNTIPERFAEIIPSIRDADNLKKQTYQVVILSPLHYSVYYRLLVCVVLTHSLYLSCLLRHL